MNDKKKLQSIIDKSLLEVNQENMIARYNNSLFLLTGKRTNLQSFHIDCCGFSPEIAEEFNDLNYLNPYGVNRQFILIDICQEDLPSVMASFSSSPFIIKSFIFENRKEILALTAQDSVYGHLENNTPTVEKLSDILDIAKVKVFCDTPSNIVQNNKLITQKHKDLMEGNPEDLLSFDSVNDLAELCKKTKSVNYDCYLPVFDTFTKDSYYTDHFGGFYLLQKTSSRNNAFKVIIYLNEEEFPVEQIPAGFKAFHWKNYPEVIKFLKNNKILVPICNTMDKNSKISTLEDIKKRIIFDHMLTSGKIDFDSIDDMHLSNSFLNENMDNLPDDYIKINNLVKMIEKGTANKSYVDRFGFYSLKINPSLKQDHVYSLLNHLIVNYTDYSYRRMFKYNIELFMKKFSESSGGTKKLMISYVEKISKDFS